MIGLALVLYAVEFVADKVPWVDTLWDTVHTFIRPLGGAAVAVAALGDASPGMTALVALLGGTVAAGAHATKAGTRVVVNTSPEPFSNWILSLAEDGFVVALGLLALKYPLAALVVSSVVIVGILMIAAVLCAHSVAALGDDGGARSGAIRTRELEKPNVLEFFQFSLSSASVREVYTPRCRAIAPPLPGGLVINLLRTSFRRPFPARSSGRRSNCAPVVRDRHRHPRGRRPGACGV